MDTRSRSDLLLSVGYKPNANHNFNMLVTGAPQWHHQNFDQSLEYYEEYGIDANQMVGFTKGRAF